MRTERKITERVVLGDDDLEQLRVAIETTEPTDMRGSVRDLLPSRVFVENDPGSKVTVVIDAPFDVLERVVEAVKQTRGLWYATVCPDHGRYDKTGSNGYGCPTCEEREQKAKAAAEEQDGSAAVTSPPVEAPSPKRSRR